MMCSSGLRLACTCDGVDQVGQALEREVLALHGHDRPMRAHNPFSVSRLSDGGQSTSTKS